MVNSLRFLISTGFMSGQLLLDLMVTVSIISRAGAFRGNHGRPQRALRLACAAERRTFRGLFNPLQYQTADAFRTFLGRAQRHAETLFGIKFPVFFPQAESALGDFPDPPPFPVDDTENLFNNFLGMLIALPAHRAGVL